VLVVSAGFPTNKSSELKIVSGNPDAEAPAIIQSLAFPLCEVS